MASIVACVHGRSSPLSLLNEDCITELVSRCATKDILRLRETCKFLASFIKNSHAVWFRKLADDFGIDLSCPQATGASDKTFLLARLFHECRRTSTARYQAILVNGGIDTSHSDDDRFDPLLSGPNMAYWADNLFTPSGSPYCSDCPSNADIVGLLLDMVVDSDRERLDIRGYLTSRCRYAAALLRQVQDPEHAMRRPDDLPNVVEGWQDQHLEHFFVSLLDGLDDNHAMGRLLLFDIPHEETEREIERMHSYRDIILNRTGNILRNVQTINKDTKTMFDGSLVPRIIAPDREHLVSIVHELMISRRGSLTCPVASGVVFAGIVDFEQLKDLSNEEIAHRLHEATQDPVCTFFDDRTSLAFGDPSFQSPYAPRFHKFIKQSEGYVHVFDTQHDKIGVYTHDRSSNKKVVEWKPLLWFRFHNYSEAVAHKALDTDVNQVLYKLSFDSEDFNHPRRTEEIYTALLERVDKLKGIDSTIRSMVETIQGTLSCSNNTVPLTSEERETSSACQDYLTEARESLRKVMKEKAFSGFDDNLLYVPFYDERLVSLIRRGHDIRVGIEQILAKLEADIKKCQECLEGKTIQREEENVLHAGEHTEEEIDDDALDDDDDIDDDALDDDVLDDDDIDDDDQDEMMGNTVSFSTQNTRHRATMTIPVMPCAANIIMVKLIDQENLMEVLEDFHDWPNIDMTLVRTSGKNIQLPKGVTVASYAKE